MFNGEIIFPLKVIDTEKHMWVSGFYRIEHIYSYKRQELQNILERNYATALESYYLFTKKLLKG